MGRYQEGPDGEGKSPHIARLRTHHKGMARDMVAGCLRPGQISDLYGMTEGQVSRILGSPAFQAEIRRLEEGADVVAVDVREELKSMQDQAVTNLWDDLEMEVMTGEERRIRQKASLEVLGINGHVKKTSPSGPITIIDNRTQTQIDGMTTKELRETVFTQIEDKGDG